MKLPPKVKLPPKAKRPKKRETFSRLQVIFSKAPVEIGAFCCPDLMAAPLVSVVMPARNAAATVAAAIASLQAQELRDFEIVVIDHDSGDSTSSIVREMAEHDPRIRLFRCPGTFVEAANLAWREATGTLIARMDSDDVAAPERLRLQRDLLLARPDISACGSLVRILKRNPDGGFSPPDAGYLRYEKWINSLVEPDEIAAQRFVDSPMPNPATMVRREVLEAVGGYHDPAWAEDYDLWLRLLEGGYRLAKVPQVLLDWHDAGTRSTRTVERYSLRRFQEAKAHFLARLPAVRDLGVVICGAGPIGKEMAGLLRHEGIRVHAFMEVNPRRIGNLISGAPVYDINRVGEFAGKAIPLPAVGRGTGRETIRQDLLAAGFIEGGTFFCVA
jgi:glycosyltransferase involved in cell wall biosynthesis